MKQSSRDGRSFGKPSAFGSKVFPIDSNKNKKQEKDDTLLKVYDSAFGIVTTSCTTEAIMESLMTMILLASNESSRKSAAIGSRRCKEALNNGWRCEGNLFFEFGLG